MVQLRLPYALSLSYSFSPTLSHPTLLSLSLSGCNQLTSTMPVLALLAVLLLQLLVHPRPLTKRSVTLLY